MKSKMFIWVLVIAFLFSFTMVVKDAKADAILFPWVVKSNTVSTLISVVNTAGDPTPGTFDYQLHYQYWYKGDEQTSTCEAISFKKPTSKDDIVTFDAAGNFNDGFPLFNDPNNYGAQSFELPEAPPCRAFLIVDNNTPALVNAGVNADGTLYGEAMVLEIAGGAAWGYIAYNAAGGEEGSQTAPVNCSDGNDVLGEVIGDTEITQTVLLPADVGITRFFVTPAGANQRAGNISATLQLTPDPGSPQGGIFLNDEDKIDFDKKKYIRCTAGANLEHFMTSAAYSMFKASGAQGWAYITTTADVIIGKLEFTTSGVTIDGTPVPGTFNNFVWLRDSQTVTAPVGINDIHNEPKHLN